MDQMRTLTQTESKWIQQNLVCSEIEKGIQKGELELLPKASSAERDQVGFYLYNNCVNAREKNFEGYNRGGRFLLGLVPCDNLHDHYCKWCDKNGLPKNSQVDFSNEMEGRGFGSQDLNTLFPREGKDNEFVYLKTWGRDLGAERIGLVLVDDGRYRLHNMHFAR